MGIINALKNGTKQMTQSTANVSINVGNGHSNINVTAQNAFIDTGCGDQNITAITSQDLFVDTGHCGEDNITAIVGGNAGIITSEDDDTVNLFVGGNFAVDVGMNNPPLFTPFTSAVAST